MFFFWKKDRKKVKEKERMNEREKERGRERGRENGSVVLLPRPECSLKMGIENLFYTNNCA